VESVTFKNIDILSAFPNPVNRDEILQVASQGQLEILSLTSGQVIFEGVDIGYLHIDDRFAPGVYIMRDRSTGAKIRLLVL
jgi:hypothetical protein